MTTTEAREALMVTIRNQIGAAALMAVGARDFAYSDTDRYLEFTVTGKRGYVTKARVTLDANDTYTVAIGRMNKRTFGWEWLDSLENVYADSLAEAVKRSEAS